ncbi:MAG: hypothetical protein RJB01_801 [Actinomycetota bacterium]
MRTYLRDSWSSLVRLERTRVLGYGAIWTSIVVGVGTIWSVVAGVPSLGIAFAIGAIFVGMAEAGESLRQRLFTMIIITGSLMLATFTASLISDYRWPAIIASGLVAFASGAVGKGGPRFAMGGVLTLVTFLLFVAEPAMANQTLESTFFMGLGGFITTLGPVITLRLRRFPELSVTSPGSPSPWHLLTQGVRDRRDPFMRHGFRLSLSITITVAVALLSNIPHAIWLPVTVAWVSRADTRGIVHRVEARVVGTLIGLALAGLFTLGLGFTGVEAALVAAVSAGLTVGFIWANYPLGVAGITMVVIVLFAIDGDNVEMDITTRLIATLLAAAVVVGGSFILRGQEANRALPPSEEEPIQPLQS